MKPLRLKPSKSDSIRPTIQSTSKTNENLSTRFTNKLTNQRKKDIHITPINSIPQKMKKKPSKEVRIY
jgi:hypothetical protein